MWGKIKAWLLAKVEDALLKEIQKLDRYESVLAEIIKAKLDPDERAKQVVDWVQEKLVEAVEKAFSAKWLSSWIFAKAKESVLREVSKLDNYEDDLAAILRRHVNADEKSKLIVDYIQDYLTALVKKHIQKI
jgi:hypothetical protein